MIFKFVRNACLAAAVSLGAMGATAAPAAAESFGFGITIGKGHVDTQYRGGRHDRGYRGRGHRARGCAPGHAVRKASRIGLRHARIIRENRRIVAVGGRMRGTRAIVRMGNERGCPVYAVRYR